MVVDKWLYKHSFSFKCTTPNSYPTELDTAYGRQNFKQFKTFVCDLFIYLGFFVTFNTVQVISRRVIGRAEETSTYSSLGSCTVSCRPAASNYQLFHLRPCRESNPSLRGGRRECYHSATVALLFRLWSQREAENTSVCKLHWQKIVST